jgi:hypothetical protein
VASEAPVIEEFGVPDMDFPGAIGVSKAVTSMDGPICDMPVLSL